VIVWVASYPRSGNTLTRTLLRQVFGLESHSEHNDPILGSSSQVSSVVGHMPFEGEWAETHRRLEADARMQLVKTHSPPTDDAPTVYVVRDGRAALVSYRHYLQRLHGLTYSLGQLCDALAPMPDWSGHLDCWNPRRRPGTLLLRYEDILRTPDRVIALLERFLGREPIANWINPFDALNRLMPAFFRQACNLNNVLEWTPEELSAFHGRHDNWMRALGYDDADPAPFLSGVMTADAEGPV
jgi:hypothetical protein